MSNRETVVLVEMDIPFCTHEWGDAFASPTGGCDAVLGTDADRKCYQTRATCPVPDAYNPGTRTIRFSMDQDGIVRYYGLVIPSIVEWSITPAAINLSGMDDTSADSAVGQREVVSITFQDHRHSDLGLDKYRLERYTGVAAAGSPTGEGFDPYRRGTFWGKFLARNPYYIGYPLRVYQGYLGDDIEDMRVGHYILDKIDGPSEGQVTLTAKDAFARIEARKAMAPTASRGELAADISGTPATFTVTPSDIVEEDYPSLEGSPSELYVAIGKEIIRCSRVAATFTVLQRAALGTEQEDHDEGDLVQWVLVYTSQRSHAIAYDLLTTYGGVDTEQIDFVEWESLAESVSRTYTAHIARPTPVGLLVGELMCQAGFTIWPEISTNMIRYAAFRASAVGPTVNDNYWMAERSFKQKRKVEKRVSEVWVYYALINPLEDLKDVRNYRSRLVEVDLDAEDVTQYGAPKIREVFSRWIPVSGRQSATECGQRILANFRDPPIDAVFSIRAERQEDEQDHLDIASYFSLETEDIQDDTGAATTNVMAPVSMERGESEWGIRAQSVFFSADVTDRTIYIENDSQNLNLRTVYDSLYDSIDESSPSLPIDFIIEEDVIVGSTSTSSPSLRRGSWPTGVVIRLTNLGRIQGKGGAGGTCFAGTGTDGEAGGTALDSSDGPMIVDNTDGEIFGGGGGGGSGVSGSFPLPGGESAFYGGPGGGAGRGDTPSSGGSPAAATGATYNILGTAGGSSDTDAAGAAGTLGVDGTGKYAGPAGAGGDAGQAGAAGGLPTGITAIGAPGSGGAAGAAVVGNSNITWSGTGDIRGSQT